MFGGSIALPGGRAVSGHLLHKANEYRERAKRSREIAHWISSIEAKQHLLETAQHFEALAEREEAEARKRREAVELHVDKIEAGQAQRKRRGYRDL
jgi:hypothetical protein